MINVALIRSRFAGLSPHLDERGRRLSAATEARAAGHGGIVAVWRATGIAPPQPFHVLKHAEPSAAPPSTIGRGLRELDEAVPLAPGWMRREGGGRKTLVESFSDWDDPPPGFMEADLVAHSGPTSKGSYVQTLTLTDIATGWTECAPVLVREQKLLTEVLSELRKVLPFALLGFDTDNDSVFMNG